MKDHLIVKEISGGFVIFIHTPEHGDFPLNRVIYETEAEAKTEAVKAEGFAHAIWN